MSATRNPIADVKHSYLSRNCIADVHRNGFSVSRNGFSVTRNPVADVCRNSFSVTRNSIADVSKCFCGGASVIHRQ